MSTHGMREAIVSLRLNSQSPSDSSTVSKTDSNDNSVRAGEQLALPVVNFFAIDSSSESSRSTHVAVDRCSEYGSPVQIASRDKVPHLIIGDECSGETSSATPPKLQYGFIHGVDRDTFDNPGTTEGSSLPVPCAMTGFSLTTSTPLNNEVANNAFETCSASPVRTTLLEAPKQSHGIESFEPSAIKGNHNVEESELSQRSHKHQTDYLAELYYKGLRNRRKKEEEWESARAARDSEFQRCSFVPEITKLAKSIQRSGSVPACYRSDNNLRHRFLLEAWTPESLENCRNTPVISKGSKRIIQRVRCRSAVVIPVAERLYLDSARRQWQREEEESKYQVPVATRTPDDIKAQIDGLYEYEKKRQIKLEKLRKNADAKLRQKSLHVDSSEVVKRLLQPFTRKRRDCYVKEDPSFAPKLSPATELFSLRARKKRLEEWYRFCCQQHKTGDLSGFGAVERMWEAVREANLPQIFPISAFIEALATYEENHGPQNWHSTLPPTTPHIDKELTFIPKINKPRKERTGDNSSPHQRLFKAAKIKQIMVREQELKKQEVLLIEAKEQQEKKKKLRALSRQNAKLLRKQGKVEVVSSQLSSVPNDYPCTEGNHTCSHTQKSNTPESPNAIPTLFSHLSLHLHSHILGAVENLRSLIEAQELPQAGRSPPLSVNQEALVLARSTQPSCAAGVTGALGDHSLSESPTRHCKAKHRFSDLPVSTDVLLECALGRPSWSSDVEARRLERLESSRRLRALGKTLYQKM